MIILSTIIFTAALVRLLLHKQLHSFAFPFLPQWIDQIPVFLQYWFILCPKKGLDLYLCRCCHLLLLLPLFLSYTLLKYSALIILCLK